MNDFLKSSPHMHTKYMHIDHIEIRYDTIQIEFSISNFDTIRYVSNFQYRILQRYNLPYRISIKKKQSKRRKRKVGSLFRSCEGWRERQTDKERQTDRQRETNRQRETVKYSSIAMTDGGVGSLFRSCKLGEVS